MHFSLNDEQLMLQKMMRAFADEIVAPGAIERDKTKAFPIEIFNQLAEMGIMGLPFPEEYGGDRRHQILSGCAHQPLGC